jgi:hypothetical protein
LRKCGRTNNLQPIAKPGCGSGRTQQHWALVLNFNQTTFINIGCGRTQGQFHICAKPRALAAIMHFTTILFFSFSLTLCFGQTKKELKIISEFKKNFLKNKKQNFNDTLNIGNLRITGQVFYEYRVIKTFDKSKDFIVGEQFYDNIKQIKEISKYDTVGHPIGIAKHYTKKGELQYIQNYENGEWIVYDKQSHPYYDLQTKIKAKADSLIIKMYGGDFLQNHSLWNIDGSYILKEGRQRIRWTEFLKDEPTKFSFCYKVKLDSQNIYNSYIYFDLDNNGNFIPNFQGGGMFFSGSGFENVPDSIKGSFRLNYNDALIEAKKLGLIETDSTKAYGQLFWEDFRKSSIYNGQFRFYIPIKTKTLENSNPNGRSSKTTKYDVYSFSPWTGNFIEVKKMKIFQWWEKDRSGFSLLEPDKD